MGVDLSAEMVRVARETHPEFEFHVGDVEDAGMLATLRGPFDAIVISDTIGYFDDCEATLAALRPLCTSETRVVIAYYERSWEPALRIAEWLRLKMPHCRQNWLATRDTINLLTLADYEVVRREWRQLVPRRLFGVGTLVNRFVAPLPGIRRLSLRTYIVARPLTTREPRALRPSVTVVIPSRNERGKRRGGKSCSLAGFAPEVEIIFVEGHSSDGTFEECERVRAAWPDRDIKVLRQEGRGKADAVRKGFAAARGDILMIFDADLTTPPESLPKFYEVLATGKGEFVNGTRLIYPMEPGAMRALNFFANRTFAVILSFLLNQTFTDTLCGTKALWRRDYERIVAQRSYFGDFDPFGDFDLIFGASKLNLKMVEVPVRYAGRAYGETQISRFAHGWLLARMVAFAWRKLKAF